MATPITHLPDTRGSEYVLSPEERAALEEITTNANLQLQGALRMICKIHGLEGNWQYSADGVLRKGG